MTNPPTIPVTALLKQIPMPNMSDAAMVTSDELLAVYVSKFEDNLDAMLEGLRKDKEETSNQLKAKEKELDKLCMATHGDSVQKQVDKVVEGVRSLGHPRLVGKVTAASLGVEGKKLVVEWSIFSGPEEAKSNAYAVLSGAVEFPPSEAVKKLFKEGSALFERMGQLDAAILKALKQRQDINRQIRKAQAQLARHKLTRTSEGEAWLKVIDATPLALPEVKIDAVKKQ